jgi:hypothetical protein
VGQEPPLTDGLPEQPKRELSAAAATIDNMQPINDGAAAANLRFSPRAVLGLAFGEHDFTTHHQGGEVHIQTFEPGYDGEVAYIDVNAIDNTNDDGAVTYRYRIELATAVDPPG